MSEVAYVALGSNLGNRSQYLADARAALGRLPGSRVIAESDIEETQPLGDLPQPPYLNQMLKIETALPPRDLLAHLHDIEARLGRTRNERWASRTIDLDLVSYDDVTSDDPALRLPHPGLATRDFWQREVAQLDRGRRDA